MLGFKKKTWETSQEFQDTSLRAESETLPRKTTAKFGCRLRARQCSHLKVRGEGSECLRTRSNSLSLKQTTWT